MTYRAYEQSNHDAQPVSLYSFIWGNTRWDYNNSDREWVIDGNTHVPAAISEKAVQQGGERIPEFTIETPYSLPVVALHRGSPPSTRVQLLVQRFHPEDPDLEVITGWTGPVSNVQPVDLAKARIVSRITRLRRTGLRETYSRGCKLALYGPGCNVDKATFAVSRNVSAIDGNVVTLDDVSPSEGYFNGGFIEWDADGAGTLERRTIERETASDTYLLFGRGDGLSVSQAVTVYPGCRRNYDDCNTKFSNAANYPGLDFMLDESPFEGKVIF